MSRRVELFCWGASSFVLLAGLTFAACVTISRGEAWWYWPPLILAAGAVVYTERRCIEGRRRDRPPVAKGVG